MPTLEWIGKDKVIHHHQDAPFRVLEHRYSYPAGAYASDEAYSGAEASGNMIIKGDNLEALKALLPQYEGRVKCVYIDPPYNTGNEGWVYNDLRNVGIDAEFHLYRNVGHGFGLGIGSSAKGWQNDAARFWEKHRTK
jgi:hypothetical protein